MLHTAPNAAPRGVEIEDVPDCEDTASQTHRLVEEYPAEGLAGAAYPGGGETKFDQILREKLDRGECLHGPFEDDEEWELAKWLIDNVGQTQTDKFHASQTRKRTSPSFESNRQFLDRIDALPIIGPDENSYSDRLSRTSSQKEQLLPR